jgi:integrase
LDSWFTAAGIETGKLFRRVSSAGKAWGAGVTEKVVWHVVKEFAKKIGVTKLAPHDLRRTCARLCHSAGGELEQIQFPLGHVSVQTTDRPEGAGRVRPSMRGALPTVRNWRVLRKDGAFGGFDQSHDSD